MIVPIQLFLIHLKPMDDLMKATYVNAANELISWNTKILAMRLSS